MILYSTRAQIGAYAPEVVAWGQEVAKLVGGLQGSEVQFASRVGGHQELIWASRYDNMAALEASLSKVQQNAQYLALVKTAVEKGYFIPSSVETALWSTV
jgi:hypothetical protein